MELHTHQADSAGDTVRLAELYGRPHVVAPVVMVVEGVLKDQYLPADEIVRSVAGWNGRPITAPPERGTEAYGQRPDSVPDGASGHPINADGEYVSANDDPFSDDMRIGEVRHATVDEDGTRLTAEAWIDVERVESVGRYAVQALKSLADGDPLDVSIGFWNTPIPRSGRFNGEAYDAVVTDVMPDHLALLPNEDGACSWSDGCGVPRAASAELHAAVADVLGRPCIDTLDTMNDDPTGEGFARRASPRTPSYSGTETTPWGSVDKSFGAYRNAFAESDASTWTDLPASDRQAIASKSLNGDPQADTFDDGLVLPVVNPSTNRLNEGALRNALSRAPQTAGINVAATQAKCRSLLTDEFDLDLEAEAMGLIDRLKAYLTGDESRTTTMTDDIDIEALAEETGVAADTLRAMSDDEVSSLHARVFEADDETPDGDDPDPADGDDAEEETPPEATAPVEELRERLASIEDQLHEQTAAAQAEDIETIVEATDLDAEAVSAWNAEAIEAFATQVREVSRQSGPMTINRLAQAGASTAPADDEDDGLESVGALRAMSARENGSD